MNNSNDTLTCGDSQTAVDNRQVEKSQPQAAFTQVFDTAIRELGFRDGVILCLVYRHCKMSKGVFSAGIKNKADNLDVDHRQLRRRLRYLVSEGYIADLTPDRKNKAHDYIVTKKGLEVLTNNGEYSLSAKKQKNRRSGGQNGTLNDQMGGQNGTPRGAKMEPKKNLNKQKRNNTSSCGLDSEKPETANGRQAHDDDGLIDLLYQGLEALGYDAPGTDKLLKAKSQHGGLETVKAKLEWYADHGLDKLRDKANWRGVLYRVLENDKPAPTSQASPTPKSDVADYTQDKQYKFFAELETEEKQAASGNGQKPPLPFLDKMRQMTERLDAKQPVVHDYTGFNSYNPEDGSYNL